VVVLDSNEAVNTSIIYCLQRFSNLTLLEAMVMGDKGGSKDKGKKEKQKKAKLSPKEKRKARTDKKNKSDAQL
jgi:hypothetical protein